MINKKYILCSLLLLTCPTYPNDNNNTLRNVGIALAATGGTYLLSKGWAHHVVKLAQTQFTYERNLLNQYRYQYGHNWSDTIWRSLRKQLKANIVHIHNAQRDRWQLCVLYDMYTSNPSLYVEHRYYTFPLLQHVADLSWYIKRLKIIRFCHLHSERDELDSLIEQLNYIKDMIISDHDYNIEEQNYS